MDVDVEMTCTSEIKNLSLAKHHHTGKDLQKVRPVKARVFTEATSKAILISD
jgi:hypothetical protein